MGKVGLTYNGSGWLYLILVGRERGLTLYLVCRRPLLGGMVTMAGRITWGHSQRTHESVSSQLTARWRSLSQKQCVTHAVGRRWPKAAKPDIYPSQVNRTVPLRDAIGGGADLILEALVADARRAEGDDLLVAVDLQRQAVLGPRGRQVQVSAMPVVSVRMISQNDQSE